MYGGAFDAASNKRKIRGTPAWQLKKQPELPKPLFFEKIGKGEHMLAAGRVPVTETKTSEPVRYVAHTRPYEKPWKGEKAEPILYFDKK